MIPKKACTLIVGLWALQLPAANVDLSGKDGTTAVHRAVHRDDLDAVKRLIREGANVKAVNRYGSTPLALACTNGNAAMIDALLAAGADPNAPLPGGETPLMTAARTGRADAVKVLLARGANVNAKESRRGQTAIMWAAAEGYAPVVDLLVEFGADFRARLDSGFTPLLFAAREGRMAAVKSLLEAGADVNDAIKPSPAAGRNPGAPRAGSSPLMLAVVNGHFELAAMLIEAGANVNDDATGWSVLHAISQVRKPGVGDNNPAPDGSGSMTSLEFVKFAKQHGANLNARMTKKINVGLTGLNTTGATPFLLAARSADAELMRFLASLGADPSIPNADGATPLIVAAGLGTRSPGEDAGTEPEVIEAVQVALDLGNDINAVDRNGETAMHGAAYKNLPGVVEHLASKGADIKVWNRKNKYGWTPLTIAEGHRFGNFKPSLVTVAALHKVMRAAGVEPVSDAGATGKKIYQD